MSDNPFLDYIYTLETDTTERANFAQNPIQAMTASGLSEDVQNAITTFLALQNITPQQLETSVAALVAQFPPDQPVGGGVTSSGPP